MAAVPRELFAPGVDPSLAYVNEPLPLPDGQTISQPLVVGRMVELLDLRWRDHVLDVGCGSGWHAAVIARLAEHVWAIERHASLVALARENLARAGVTNVTVLHGDGTHAYGQASLRGVFARLLRGLPEQRGA
jgi:protein-L-isoaspartate(D-aspartate) O-methyltransferase